jgi:CRISPR/Cas system CMR-associated protein Cmr1 (group 7 of RAMP superfamily)
VVPEQELFLQLMPALPTTRDENLKAAGATLLVGLLLGGIGQRSRRGAGSLRIKSLKGPIGIDISAFQQASSVKDYAKALETVLRDAKNMALASVCPLPHQAAGGTFPMLTKKSAGIMLMEFDAKSESDARAEVMFKLRRHKNAAFGLPYLKPAQGDNEKRGRHASPLWIRLAPFHKRWLATLTVMKSGTLAGNPGKLDKYLDDIHTRHGGISVAIP